MRIKASIIVPVYNAEPFLDNCIRSILQQTCPDFELILINDGSTDQSGAICKCYQAEDARIVYLEQENAGVSRARNRGIDAARGEFITMVDADDWVEPQFLERLLWAQAQYQADLTVCELEDIRIDDCGKRESDFGSETYLEGAEILEQVCPIIVWKNGRVFWGGACCKLYRKELLDRHHIRYQESLKIAEDQIFNLSYAVHCEKFFYLPESLYNRLLHDGSATCRFRKNIYDEVRAICAAYIELQNSYTWNDKTDVYFYKFLLTKRIFKSYLFHPESPRKPMKLWPEYYEFLSEAPIARLWRRVRITRCRGVKDFVLVLCIKTHQTALLTFLYWLWKKIKRE